MSGVVGTYRTAQKEFQYKVLVVGDFGVGKTSIIRRYTEGYFTPNYKMTIGVDFALKTIDWNSNTRINLQLWDIAGHERFGHMTRIYYKFAMAAIVVFDVSRGATFEAVPKWLQDLHSTCKVQLPNDHEPVPVLLLANKCDLVGQQINTSMLNSFCRQQNFIGWFPTSAKDDINIDESIQYLVSHILNNSTDTPQVPQHAHGLGKSLILVDDEDVVQKQSMCCASS